MKKIDIPELCLALDDIGKYFEKLSIVSQYYNIGKIASFKFYPDRLKLCQTRC